MRSMKLRITHMSSKDYTLNPSHSVCGRNNKNVAQAEARDEWRVGPPEKATKRNVCPRKPSKVTRWEGLRIKKEVILQRRKLWVWHKDSSWQPFFSSCAGRPSIQNFKHINHEYHGVTDPQEHLMIFENIVQIYQYIDEVKCRVFLTILADPAQQWFRQLSPHFIHCFEDLRGVFIN